MILQLIRFFRGFLIVSITGNALEVFVSQIMRSGISLWDLKRIRKDHYQGRLYASDFNRLRPLLRNRMCQVKIIKKKGLPFILKNARRRYFLVFGLIVFLLIFYFGSSFVWFVDISGLEKIKEEEITYLLKERGISPGIMKQKVDLAGLEKYLRQKEQRIAWVDTSWQGTRLFIEIVEKKQVEKTRPGNVYAAKDGVITKLIVLKGQPVVSEGETVITGQPLIIARDSQERARGVVKAYVWYEGTGEAELFQSEIIYTGRRITRWGLNVGEKTIWLSPTRLNFKNYTRRQEIKTSVKWRNIGVTIELIKEEYQEINYIRKKRSKEMTLFLAKEKAVKSILILLAPGTVVHETDTELLNADDPELIRVRVLLKAEEDIAKEGFSGSS